MQGSDYKWDRKTKNILIACDRTLEAALGGWRMGHRIVRLQVEGCVELGCILQCSDDAEWTKRVRNGV